MTHPDAVIFRQVKPTPGKAFVDIGLPLSDRGAQRAVNAYHAEYGGQMVQVNAHDLRRTYAKFCRDAGME